MMKKLLFNLTATQPSFGVKRHGGGIYGEIVLKKIIEQKRIVIVAYDSSLWLNPDIKNLCELNSVEMIDISKCSMQEVIDKTQPDIFYSPQPLDSLYALENCDLVVTVHDFRDVEMCIDRKMFWRYKISLKKQLKNILWCFFPSYIRNRRYRKISKFVMDPHIRFPVVSNHSLSSYRLFFPGFTDRDIPVFFSPSTIDETPLERKRTADYFLLVSGDRWEKNNLRAIVALDQLCSAGQLNGKKVIVTGVKSADRYRYKIQNPGIFEFVGYVDDSELRQLYHDAYCFIYPSLNEGFGYPPLEAMYYGVPVLASPFSSISEICGDAAIYFNPYSVDEIKMRIIQVLDQRRHDCMSKKSLEHYALIRQRQDSDLEKLVKFIYNDQER